MTKIGKQQNLRRHRWSAENAFYFVTTRVEEPSVRLDNEHIANIIFDCLKWLEENNRADFWVCMIMPDHLHLVFQLKQDNLSRLMNVLKGYVSRKIKESLNRKGMLFQNKYYDHYIRRDEDLEQILRYCLENPIRKGLVDAIDDYPYWKCKFDI